MKLSGGRRRWAILLFMRQQEGRFLGGFATIIAATVFFSSACTSEPELITIPDYSETSATTAETSLTALQLIPRLKEQASDRVDEGKVISTSPAAGTEVELFSPIDVIVSSGPASVLAKDSYIEWTNVGFGDDEWTFETPKIADGKLTIRMTAVLSRSLVWHDAAGGTGYGVAAINDTFDKSVPLRIQFAEEELGAGETHKLTLTIPVTDLDVDKPTRIYMRLFAVIKGNYDEIPLTLTMTW